MNKLKKLIAIILCVLCVTTSIASTASAADDMLSHIMNTLLGSDLTMEPDIDERFLFGVHYEIDSVSGVKVMYKPNPDIELTVPSKVEVTGDFPLSIDYECYAWVSADGKLYYPGDYISCSGKMILYAVWREKQDNDPKPIRAIKTGFQTIIRMIQSALGIFDVVNTPADELTTTTTKPTTTKKPIISLTDAENA